MPVVEPCSLELFVLDLEAQGPDEVQGEAGGRGGAGGGARVLRDLFFFFFFARREKEGSGREWREEKTVVRERRGERKKVALYFIDSILLHLRMN